MKYSLIEAKGVDGGGLQKQIQLEVDRNKAILERILDVTLFWASRYLAFRGSTENLNDVRNGNFLGMIELLGRYDPLLKDNLRKVREKRPGTKTTHYLSPESQN